MNWRKYFSVYELSFLSLMATLVCVITIFLKTPIKVPGHMAIFFVIPFIIGIGVTRKFGSGLFMGVLAGLLIGLIGTGDKGILNVFEYMAMGITMDFLALVFKGHLGNVLVGCIIGAFGSFAKLLVNYYVISATGLSANILIIGIGVTGTAFLVFGGIGGVISSAVLNRIQHIHFLNQNLYKTQKPKT